MEDFLEKLIINIPVFVCLPFCIIFVFFIHEFAHFLAARLVGMKVEDVSIGAGKKIMDKTDRFGTKWKIRMWPIKAYVHIADYHPEKGEPLFKRLFVVLAGPLSNFILPFFLFFLFFFTWGKPFVPPVISAVEIEMTAYKAGIKAGDEIISINNVSVKTMEEVKEFTKPEPDGPLLIKVKRGHETLEFSILPKWEEYRDTQGSLREHGRIGVMANQLPNDLELIKTIDGFEVEDEEQARELVIKNLGGLTELGLETAHKQVHDYIVYLDEELNHGLFDEDDEHYDAFYVGRLGENKFMKLSLMSAAALSYEKSSDLVYNMMIVPFNLFPIDKEWISPGAKVSRETTLIGFYIYKLVFLTALFSVLIGWINLVPFPGFDGYVILINIAEAMAKKKITNRSKALLIAGALFVLYLSAFIVNAPDLPGYLEFKLEKLNE